MLARVMAASVQPTRPIQASMQVGVFVCTLSSPPMQAVWQTLTEPLQRCVQQRKLETLKPAVLNIVNESYKHAGHAGELKLQILQVHAWHALPAAELLLTPCLCAAHPAGNPGGGPDAETHFRCGLPSSQKSPDGQHSSSQHAAAWSLTCVPFLAIVCVAAGSRLCHRSSRASG